MTFTIKLAQNNDYKSLVTLSNQLGYPTNAKVIKNRLKDILNDSNHIVFVAIEKKEVIAWVHAYKTLRIESDPFVEISGLVVDENYRKKRIGKNLVNQIIDWANDF